MTHDAKASGVLCDLQLTGPIDLSRLVLLCADTQNAEVCAKAMGATAVAPRNNLSLIEAARALRRHSSKLKLIVCGTDDFKAPGKPAALEAELAARAADGELAYPVFAPGHYRQDYEITFLDLYKAEGIGAVREAIEAAKSLDVIEAQGGDFETPRHMAMIEQVEAAILKLAALPATAFQLQKKPEANRLGITPRYLEKRVNEAREAEAARAVKAMKEAPPIELWPESVDGNKLLTALTSTVQKYVALTDAEALTVALWVVFAHAHGMFDISPILAISSPLRRCGKTTLLGILHELVPRPLMASNLTLAVVYSVEEPRTLLVDEADTFLLRNPELRGVLNSGHHRTGAFVLRAHVGKGGVRKTERFSTFFPKAIALIGGLPPTLADRSIHIRLKRKLRSEKLQRFSLTQTQELNNLCRMTARWVADRLNYFSRYNPETPASLHDRASDNWRPLLAIAELADELDLAKEAAVEIEAVSEDGEVAVQLLGDCKRAFEDLNAEALASKDIIAHVHATGEGPWAEKPLTEKKFAEILRPLGLKSQLKRFRKRKPGRLWFKTSFEDAWIRYL